MPRNKTSEAKLKARNARQTPSVAEQIVWKLLRGRATGFKFRREHPVGPYRIDFFCREAMLAVEMDGEQHDPERDKKRDEYLAGYGILTHRIPNRRFFGLEIEPFQDDLNEIVKLCKARTSPPSPPNPSPQEGRGE